jgi:hypothetical protein
MTRFLGIVLISLSLSVLWHSCSDKDLYEPESKQGEEVYTNVDAYVEMRVALPVGATPVSRADDDSEADTDTYEGVTSGNSYNYDYRNHPVDENDVRSITIFVVGLDSNGEEVWDHATSATMAVDDADYSYDSSTGCYCFNQIINIKTYMGRKHLYLGANLPDELVSQFIANHGVFMAVSAMTADDYSRLIRRFVIHTDTDEFGAIAMFCTGYSEIEIGKTEDDNDGSAAKPYQRSAQLERMVAKILFTCDEAKVGTSVTDNRLAAIKANIQERFATDFPGWMRLNSVRFKLGTTNRTAYFVKHTDSQGNVIDPNYKVADQLSNNVVQYTLDTYGNSVATGTDWGYADDKYTDQFTYYDVREELEFLPYYDTFEGENIDRYDYSVATCMRAQLYEDSRMPTLSNVAADGNKVYTAGMYCLENTTDNNWGIFDGTYLNERRNWFLGPRMIATNLVIETQYIPATILDDDCLELYYNENGKAIGVRKTPYLFSDDPVVLNAELAQGDCKNGMEIEGLTGDAESRARQFLALHNQTKGQIESGDPWTDVPSYYAYKNNNYYHFYTVRGAERYIELARQIEGAYVSSLDNLYYYPNGLGYYHSYLNQVSSTPSASTQTLLDVERNTYYIVRCTRFNVPATIDNSFQMITYQTNWADWVYSGQYSTENDHLFPE